MKLTNGDNKKEHFIADLKTLTHPDMPHSVLKKLLRSQLQVNTSMTMLNDQDLAED